MSLYRKTLREKRRFSALEKAYDDNAIGIEEYSSNIEDAQRRYLKKLMRFRKRNPVISDAFSGRRSVADTVREYSMHSDKVLPGAYTHKMRKVSRQLRRVLGMWEPLEPPVFRKAETKIAMELKRAEFVDRMIMPYRRTS